MSDSSRVTTFFSLDLRALALWRMALGAVVLLDISLRLRDLQAFYGDFGMLSRTLYFSQSWEYPGYHLFLASGSTGGLLALFGIWAMAATCLMIGYQARWAGLVTWYCVTSIQLRNPMVLDGGDDLLRVLLFWTPFLPLSARWSWDARKRPDWSRLPNDYASIATLAVTLQFALIYFFAALLKNGDDWLKTGDALYYTVSIDQFATTLGRYLAGFPDLLRPLSYASIGLEYLLALLVLLGARFLRARAVFYVLAVCLHLGIASMLHFGAFMTIAIAGLTAFFPTFLLDRWLPTEREVSSKAESVPVGYTLALPTKIFVSFIIAMIVTFNVYSVNHVHKVPAWALPVMAWTFEHQHWHFFAPNPYREDGWFAFEVTKGDGQILDLWENGPSVGGKPVSVSSRFFNQRWRRWLQNLIQINLADRETWRRSTLEWLALGWAREHPGERAKMYRLVFYQELTPPPGAKASVTPVELARLIPNPQRQESPREDKKALIP